MPEVRLSGDNSPYAVLTGNLLFSHKFPNFHDAACPTHARDDPRAPTQTELGGVHSGAVDTSLPPLSYNVCTVKRTKQRMLYQQPYIVISFEVSPFHCQAKPPALQLLHQREKQQVLVQLPFRAPRSPTHWS